MFGRRYVGQRSPYAAALAAAVQQDAGRADTSGLFNGDIKTAVANLDTAPLHE
jgi:hypothetical protein